MSLGELKNPITIYWDLTPAPAETVDYLRICRQVREARPLQLHLLDNEPAERVQVILDELQSAPMAVILTTEPQSLDPGMIASLQDSGLKGLLLRLTTTAGLSDATGFNPDGISFVVDAGNWQQLPEVVRFCLASNLSLTLPMQRLYYSEQVFMLDDRQQKDLTEELAGIDFKTLRLTIHDPFLWRAFNAHTPFPGCGCQAANTMLAIAPDATVHPCPSLPLCLGNLADVELKDILAGQAKKELRTQLKELPTICSGCSEETGCHGGCRGRSLVICSDLRLPDPGCHYLTERPHQ